jgi:fatty-acyl-CoA synthase
MPTSAWACWTANAGSHPDRDAVVHWVAGEPPYRWTWGALLRAARSLSVRLAEMGVRKGDVCAIIFRHHRRFYPLYLAVSGLGALPAVLAYPNPRLHPEKFREGLEGMSLRSGLDWVLTEKELDGVIRPLSTRSGSTIRQVLYPLEWSGEESAASGPVLSKDADPGSPCLLQHSSGTTGLQKAVVLSHRAVLEHVHRYGSSIQAAPDDRIVSWLPLYHDMGLIAAFYLPLVLGIPLVQLDPFEWVTAPAILLEAISAEKGTLTWLPNFAYNLMADRIRDEDLEGIRLDTLRMAINCSEPVRADSHDRFHRRFAPYGFRREALCACYAMAETTFAVTQTTPGIEARRITVSRKGIGNGSATPAEAGGEPGRECVSSGGPISGCEIRIVGDEGEDLPAGQVGEIAIRSVSLFDGYRNFAEKTAEVFRDGWYFSGDYGFQREGELYVIGRKKDIIIVAGKNIYPEDIEDTVGSVEGVLPGRVIAFGLEDEDSGTEQVCVVAESPALEDAPRKRLRLAIREACMAIDVTVARVYLAPPRWLIKSSAGKPARRANRERAVNDLSFR